MYGHANKGWIVRGKKRRSLHTPLPTQGSLRPSDNTFPRSFFVILLACVSFPVAGIIEPEHKSYHIGT